MSGEMERPRSGLSMASSIATTTSVNQGSRPSTRSIKRVHTFGKREYSIKRDPNSPVVIRGWLYKQDSQGLRLWKRRWFVLSDFCLFYYRDSREETVLGSILLPSYEVLPANPREVKNRRYSFKAEHPGMRTYYFGADTQEDMNAWIRAMNQSALVVADNKKKNGHGHNLSSQDDLYASYEDFCHSEINTVGDDGKSAESLEIAHLSETRSQDESSRDSLPEHDRNGDFEKDRLFSGLRESLTDAMQHYTSVSQNGAVPPPTPECAVKNMEFAFSRQEVESKMSLDGKDSIPEDEEWVPFHKAQSSAEPNQARSPSGPHPNGFECPHDEYTSPHSCSAPSSAMLPAHTYSTEVTERNWSSRDEKFTQQNETVENQNFRIMAPHPTSQSPTSACSPPENDYMLQRLVKASRSQSLPPTPSEVSRHLMVQRSPPPNLKYASPIHYMDVPHPNAASSVGSPTRKQMPLTPCLSPKIQSPKQRAASNEDVFVAVTGSPSLGRITVRSNTPIGRVDILPSEDRIPNSANIRHNEERASEYYVTSSRTRNHIVKSTSRPQTPSDRYDVMPLDDPFAASTLAKGPNRYTRRSQPTGAEDERMLDGSGMIINARGHGYPNRMQVRPNTPSERVIVEEYAPELSLTPSLRRHRSQGQRYSERPFLPPAAFSGRGVGYAPRHLSKMGSASYVQLPPLPPVSTRPHLPAGKRMSLSAVPSGSSLYRDRGSYAGRVTENGIDVLLNKLCGQDKILISIEEESAHLRAEKEKLEDALQLTHHHLEEFQGQEQATENIWYQQRILQDDLVYVRARLCDLSLERERAWDDYRALENELHTVRDTLERVSMIGHPQDQAAAHRDLWIINDIMAGLRFNKTNFHVIPDPARHTAAVVPPSPASETQPAFQRSFLHSQSGLNPLHPRDNPSDFEAIPPRPPLPRHDHTAIDGTDGQSRGPSNNQNEQDPPNEHAGNTSPQSSASSDAAVPIKEVLPDSSLSQSSCPVSIPSSHKVTLEPKASPPSMSEVGTVRKQRMSTEEQMERMRRHQEAQIHEKPKPGVTAQRQNSQRSTSGPAGGRLRSSSSDTFPTGTSSQQAEKNSSEQRKPALVRVTASFYPSSVPTQKHGRQGMSPDTGQEDPTYCVVMEPHTERVTSTSHEISQMVKVTPPLRTSSKIMTATCRQMKNDKQGDSKKSSLQPDLQRSVEKIKTSPSSVSPATSPRSFKRLSDEGYTAPMDGERERILNLSYTLATEASELGKIITAKVLAEDCDANSDISSSEETYPWDFLQDTCNSKTSAVKENCQLKTTTNQSYGEERSLSTDGNFCSSIVPDQHGSEGASSPNTAKDRPNKRLLDNLHYENWPGHKHDGNKNHFPATKQDSGAPVKCSGQVAKYDFLIEDLHYNPLNLGKVADYCKEEREPIRITLLQSSF